MRFISISKQNIERTIKKVEGICKAPVVDWRIEISGEGETLVDFVAVLEDGMNFTTEVEKYQE